MKTIQDYLKTCDRQAVIGSFIYNYAFRPLSLMKDGIRNKTIDEIRTRIEENLNKFIDKLINITPEPIPDTFIFLACHCPDTGDGDIRFNLYKVSEILNYKGGYLIPTGYNLMPVEQVLSFLVADNYLTQYHINGLIVDFLYEMTFYGFDQKHREAALKELEESAKEAEENRDNPNYYITHEELMAKIEKDYGIELEKHDERQEKALRVFYKAQSEYYTYCCQIEIEKLKELLHSQSKDNNDKNTI